jgi:putative hemolysin
MDMFRTSGAEMALVVDDHGGIEGVLTSTDIVEAIVGDFPQRGKAAEQQVVERPDGSWLVDGILVISELEQVIGDLHLESDERSFYDG